MFNRKFVALAEKLALDQGISYSHIETYKNQNQLEKLIKNVNLKIDFTRLAKIAHQVNKTNVSNYLVKQEKQIVK